MLELHLGLVGQCECRARDDVHLVVMVTDRYMSACYALKYPERVSHLVLASPAGGLVSRGEIDRHVVFGVVRVCTGLTWAPQTAHMQLLSALQQTHVIKASVHASIYLRQFQKNRTIARPK